MAGDGSTLDRQSLGSRVRRFAGSLWIGCRSRHSLQCRSSCPASSGLVLIPGLGAHASDQDVQDVSRRADRVYLRAPAWPEKIGRSAARAGARPSPGTAPPRTRGMEMAGAGVALGTVATFKSEGP